MIAIDNELNLALLLMKRPVIYLINFPAVVQIIIKGSYCSLQNTEYKYSLNASCQM